MNATCEHFETECGCIRGFGCDILAPCTKHVAWKPAPCPRAPKLTATEKRINAVNNLIGKYVDDTGNLLPNPCWSTMLADVSALHGLGRTERWHNALDSWYNMIHDNRADTKTLKWALIQYGIFANMVA